MSAARIACRPVLAGSLLALAIVSLWAIRPAQAEQPERIGLGGYCPVCIVEAGKWEKGSAAYKATYDGITYHFPNNTIRRKFVVTPARYVPALGGDCTVCYAKLGKRVAGNIRHVSRHDNRVYLFPGPKEKQIFDKSPKEFANVDLALNGACAVCLVHAKKRVPGKAQFTEVHNGFRYQFPSAKEQAVFRKNPARYTAAALKAKPARADNRAARKETLTVTGKTACAGCEHGVVPIQSPDELGLAVNTADGKVVIVEKAHTLYRSVYDQRFTGQQVRVSGSVLKRQGRFTWIEPTELTVLK
jgi:YHS domain-containing protein